MQVLGKDLEVVHVASREGDVFHSYGNPTKARKILGFNAQVDFKDGLNRLLARAN